jgi:hypothetical protein
MRLAFFTSHQLYLTIKMKFASLHAGTLLLPLLLLYFSPLRAISGDILRLKSLWLIKFRKWKLRFAVCKCFETLLSVCVCVCAPEKKGEVQRNQKIFTMHIRHALAHRKEQHAHVQSPSFIFINFVVLRMRFYMEMDLDCARRWRSASYLCMLVSHFLCVLARTQSSRRSSRFN